MRGTTRLAVCAVAATMATVGGCTCGPGPGGGPGDGGAGGSFSQPDAAKICAILEACFPGDWDQMVWNGTLAHCTSDTEGITPIPTPGNLGDTTSATGMEAPLGDVYRCLLKAGGDCQKAATCLALGGRGGTCTPAGLDQGTCQGGHLAGCSADGYGFDVDCHSYGDACGAMHIFFGQANVCGLAACSSSSQDRCVGQVVHHCAGGVMTTGDCAAIHTTCTATDGGTGECRGSATCDPFGNARCEGSTQVFCLMNGTEARYDCTRGPTLHRCVAGACAPTGTECTLDLAETCQGSSVRFCDDGFVRTVDCKALGFAGCHAGRCVATGPGGTGCTPGYTDCSGTCVDLNADPGSCGTCGRACVAGEACQAGSCEPIGCNLNGCDPGNHCDTPTGQCQPGCASDADCGTAQTCDGTGTCVCGAGTRACGARCVGPGDPTACGPGCTVCPTPPAADATCTAGTCGFTCVSGNHLCGGNCVYDQDPATCGTRCTPCPAPPANGTAGCSAGACTLVCDAGYHLSGADCVPNCHSDADCGSRDYCSGGACVACPATGNEVEPNDTQATAQPIPAGAAASTWEAQGNLCPYSDLDWWQLTLPTRGSATWSVTVPTGAVDVTVIAGTKGLGTFSCTSASPCAPATVSPNGKPLYFQVVWRAFPSAYTLDVTQP